MSTPDTALFVQLEGSSAPAIGLPASGSLVIGSSNARAQLVLGGADVDAAHCAIGKLKEGGWAVKDLGSHAGIELNGQRVLAGRLKAGDQIRVGVHTLRVLAAAGAESAHTGRTAAQDAPPHAASVTQSGVTQSGANRARTSRDGADPSAATPRSANSSSATSAAPTPTPSSAPEIPGHRMIRRLGKGAMGEVWLAVQQRLERQVALKFLAPALARDPEYVRRFEAEARAAAALNHPNVVVVFDVGGGTGHVAAGQGSVGPGSVGQGAGDRDVGGPPVHYLSMEYMEGGSVEELAQRRGALPWRDVLPIFRDAARALDYARERQLVHRDVKPANLMFGPRGVVKLADLGLATSSHPEALATGAADGKKVFGTPHFIAPEQARGEAPDHRSDLYSLGATIWRLLAGRTPFQGATTRDILRAAFTETPPALRTLAPDCPSELAALVERLIEKDARKRPQSAAEVLHELDRLVAGAVVASANDATPHAGRTPKLLVLAAVLVVAGGATWFALYRTRAHDAASDAARGSARTREHVDARASGASDEFAAPSLERANSAANASGSPTDGNAIGGDGAGVDAAAGNAAGASAPSGEDARVRELEAQLALRDAPPIGDPPTRLAALRALSLKYAGTAAAATAANECGVLERMIERDALARDEQASLREQALARLHERAGLDLVTAPLVGLVQALHELRGPAMEIDIAADPSLAQAREQRERELFSALASRTAAQLGDAEAARARGELARLPELLDALAALPALPATTDAARLAAQQELEQRRVRAQQLLAGLGADLSRHERELARSERVRLADALRAPAPGSSTNASAGGAAKTCAQQLGNLDFAAVRERLAPLAASAHAPTRAVVSQLSSDVESAERVLATLISTFASSQWKRKTIVDPRPARGGAHDVLGIDASGVRIARDGADELIAWSQFGTRPDSLAGLFNGRLAREWSADERDGIAALERLCAAALAASKLQGGLNAVAARTFGPADASAVASVFEPVREAQLSAQALERWNDELQAAQRVARALVALSEQRPAEAAADLEAVLTHARPCWVAVLLSSGAEFGGANDEAAALDSAGPAATAPGSATPGGGDASAGKGADAGAAQPGASSPASQPERP